MFVLVRAVRFAENHVKEDCMQRADYDCDDVTLLVRMHATLLFVHHPRMFLPPPSGAHFMDATCRTLKGKLKLDHACQCTDRRTTLRSCHIHPLQIFIVCSISIVQSCFGASERLEQLGRIQRRRTVFSHRDVRIIQADHQGASRFVQFINQRDESPRLVVSFQRQRDGDIGDVDAREFSSNRTVVVGTQLVLRAQIIKCHFDHVQ
mmetsp:Transcript_23654/g.66069  ORF Transcript_23654/g.66069 Transcript_23654/m.66069 type:complete len:206 (+) Transcript_23654:3-620(+)